MAYVSCRRKRLRLSLILVLLYHRSKQLKKCSKRKFWVHPILQKRQQGEGKMFLSLLKKSPQAIFFGETNLESPF